MAESVACTIRDAVNALSRHTMTPPLSIMRLAFFVALLGIGVAAPQTVDGGSDGVGGGASSMSYRALRAARRDSNSKVSVVNADLVTDAGGADVARELADAAIVATSTSTKTASSTRTKTRSTTTSKSPTASSR